MAGENWTFWLMMTNYALGVVTLLALLVVFAAVGWEFLARRVHKAHEADSMDEELQAMLRAGSHSFSVPGLGLTMADGGVEVEPSGSEAAEEKAERK